MASLKGKNLLSGQSKFFLLRIASSEKVDNLWLYMWHVCPYRSTHTHTHLCNQFLVCPNLDRSIHLNSDNKPYILVNSADPNQTAQDFHCWGFPLSAKAFLSKSFGYSYPSSSRRLAVLVRSPKTLLSRNFSAFWQLWALGCDDSSSETAKKNQNRYLWFNKWHLFYASSVARMFTSGGSREHVQVTCYPF